MKKYIKSFILIFAIAFVFFLVRGLLFSNDPRDYVDMVPFDEMEYERGDEDGLYAMMDDVVAAAQKGDGKDALDKLNELTNEYYKFSSMLTIADLRNSHDVRDEYYADEYLYMSETQSRVEQALEEMYGKLAETSCAQELEDEYFGDGFFDAYGDYDYENLSKVTQLFIKENQLISQYRQYAADRTFEYSGETITYDQLLSMDISQEEFDQAELVFLRKYNENLGNTYVELVKNRMEIAESLGYESYLDYAYENIHARTYTADEASQYIDRIFESIAPYYVDAYLNYYSYGQYYEADADDMKTYVKTVADNIGGDVKDAYDYMDKYGLYDISNSPNKMDLSYTTYIAMYEAPYIFIKPSGNCSDLTLFAHEFGHFTDAYVNYYLTQDTDLSEVYSQGLEYLSLEYSGIDDIYLLEALTSDKMMDSLSTYVDQASLAKFEELVYSLPYEDVTLEKINELYCDVCKMSGTYSQEYDEYYHLSWIWVTHLFEMPGYVISYVVSNDVAMEIYQMEIENPGSGVEAYKELLNREDDDTFLTAIEKAGISSPFSPGRVEEIGAMFCEYFGVNEYSENAA